MTRRRRGNGEGTIYKRSNGKWQAQIMVHGKRKTKSFAKQYEALQWIREMQKKGEEILEQLEPSMTVEEIIERWLRYIKGNRAPKTYAFYRGLADRYILPVLGSLHVKDLSPEVIDDLLFNVQEKFHGEGET